MTDEERRVITAFVERIAGAQQAQGQPGWGNGSAPQARQPLPPVDPEADRMLWELFNRYPEARYRITQTAFVQEAALIEAQNRIQRLEWEVENARRQGQAMASQASQQPRGMFGGMFGGGGRPAVPPPAPMPPPPQPQYPPGYNPAMLQQQPGRQGMGFLGTAVTTAAGVAGGLVLGNMLMNSLSGGGAGAHASPFGGSGGFGQQGVPTAAAWGSDAGNKDAGSPWGGSDAAGAAGSSGSGWGQDAGASSGGGWADAQPDQASYGQDYGSDASADQGGGDWGGGGSDWGGGGGSDET